MNLFRPGRVSSANRLRELLRQSPHSLRLYQTETLYHVQIDYTCQLLDVVDEVCDEVSAGLITAAIYGRLSGTGAGEADQRLREARDAAERLMLEAPAPINVSGLLRMPPK